MVAKIIKLDEYLDKHEYSILKSVTYALGMDPNNSDDVANTRRIIDDAMVGMTDSAQAEMQQALIAALDDEDDDQIRQLLRVDEVDMWESSLFSGVDLAEGFSFRCLMPNEVARGYFIDYLDECGINYLVDSRGFFAVDCPDRDSEYHVSRIFDHLTKKWDRPAPGTPVDPDQRKTGLSDIHRMALEAKRNSKAKKAKGGNPNKQRGKGKKKSGQRQSQQMGPEVSDVELAKTASGFGDRAPHKATQTIPSKKDKERGAMRQKPINLDEGVIGVTAMPIISAERLRVLAGIDTPDASTKITKVEEPVETEKPTEIEITLEQKLDNIFKEYAELDHEQRQEFKLKVLTAFMTDDATPLNEHNSSSENVISLIENYEPQNKFDFARRLLREWEQAIK